MLDADGPARARARRARQAVGRQPPAREHRGRPARRPARAAARRAVLGAGPAPARAALGVHPRASRAAARRSSSRRTTWGRPSATPTACSCSPTASCCSPARRASWSPRSATAAPATSRPRSCASCTPRATERLRWLLLKDLQILRRSPLLVALLLLLRRPGRRAAGLRRPARRHQAEGRVPQRGARATRSACRSAAQKIDTSQYANKLFESVDPIRVKTRAGGDRHGPPRRRDRGADHPVGPHAAAAVAGQPRRHRAAADGGGPLQRGEPAQDAGRGVADQVARGRRQQGDQRQAHARSSAGYLGDPAARRRRSRCWARSSRSSACSARSDVIKQTLRRLPNDAPQRADLERVANFAAAGDRQPRPAASRCSRRSASRCTSSARWSTGKHVSANAFYIALAAAVTLMIIGLFLGGGMLALEREEHAFGRLVRGPVSRWELLSEKVLLGGLAALVATVVELGVISLFDDLRWGRIAGWAAGARRRRAWRSGRWAPRSARSRATCARRRCLRSWSPCRSRSWRSSPAGSSTHGSTTSCGSRLRSSRSSRRWTRSTRGSTTPTRASPSRSRTWRVLAVAYTAIARVGAAEVRVSVSVPRDRLQDGTTAIRPLESVRPAGARRGADPQPRVPDRVGADARRVVLHARRPGARARARRCRVAHGDGLPVRDPRRRGRRPAHRPRRAGERRARRLAERDARLLGQPGRRRPRPRHAGRRASRCASPSTSRACTASSRRSCPATCARGASSRSAASATRAWRARLPADQRRLGGPRHLRDDRRGLAGPPRGVRT